MLRLTAALTLIILVLVPIAAAIALAAPAQAPGESGADHQGLFSAVATTTYTFSDVDYPGADFTNAFGINDRGDVVGVAGSYPSPGEPITGEFGFVSSRAAFSDITVPGATGPGTAAYGINNSRLIVGFSGSPSSGFAYDRQGFATIEFPGATRGTGATGLNERGDIVGSYAVDPNVGLGFGHAYLLADGKFVTIDPPELQNATASGINNSRVIVGSGYDASGNAHGFVLQDGVFRIIDFPGGSQTMPLGINDKNQIVGQVVFVSPAVRISGFLYDRGVFITIDVPGAFATAAYGINNHGDIVGSYTDGRCSAQGCVAGHGFLATPMDRGVRD